MSGHHRSHVEGDHLHRLLRHRARGQCDEQRDDPVHDVTDPAAQNDPLLQQRPGTRQAVSGGDLDAGTGNIFRLFVFSTCLFCLFVSLSLLYICIFVCLSSVFLLIWSSGPRGILKTIRY